MSNEKRYTTWNDYLRSQFGEKIFKVPLDGGFDCPNRDGHVAHGGCTFCSVSGSGDVMIAPDKSISEQFELEVAQFHKKWPGVKRYLAYFQNFTNTYAPVKRLTTLYEEALTQPDVVGIAIGTRPDCLPADVVDYLADIQARGFELWIDLGLQTTFEETSRQINRAHDYATYLDAVKRLRARDIKVCVHLINGLPGETPDMMVENVKRIVADTEIQGVKLHLLHLMRNTAMVRDYHEGRLQLLSRQAYVEIICDQLEQIPPDIVIHRLTGDAPRDTLIGPMWSLKKWEVLNAIDAELERRDSWQGKFCS